MTLSLLLPFIHHKQALSHSSTGRRSTILEAPVKPASESPRLCLDTPAGRRGPSPNKHSQEGSGKASRDRSLQCFSFPVLGSRKEKQMNNPTINEEKYPVPFDSPILGVHVMLQ